jgi:hypothetical protein
MSIHTVSPLRNGQKAPPTFVERGLAGLSPSSTIQSGVYAYIDPSHKQVAYSEYIANFAAFIKATATGQKIGTKEKGYPFKFDPASLIPLQLPTVAFTLSNQTAISTAQFRDNYPRGQEVSFAGKDVLALPNPSLEDIRNLSKIAKLDVYTPANTTNIRGIQSYLTTMKFITLAGIVHTYPGYQTKEDINAFNPASTAHKGEFDLVFSYPCNSSNRVETEEFEPLVGRQKKPAPIFRHDIIAPAYHAVHSAKPSPLNLQVNSGPAGSTPNLPGFTLPWFPAMILPDTYAITNIIHKYFHANFGADDESSSVAFNIWRREVGNWYRTPQGLAAAHILFCLDLALTAQLRQYVVIESGIYQGSVLLGENALLCAQGRIYRPIGAASLRPLIKAMSAHSSAVEGLSKLLSEMTLKEGGGTAKVSEEDLSNGRVVYRLLGERDVGSDITDELEKLLSDLAFTDNYLSPNVATVIELIKAIGLDDSSFFDDKPMFLHRKKYTDSSVEYRCLSAFGPTAPTFHNTSGSIFRLRDTSLDEVDEQTHKKRLPIIPMFMKDVSTACVDWRRMKKEQALHINLLERAVGNRALVWRDHNRDRVWSALGEFIVVEEAQDRGRKRGRGDDEDEEMEIVTKRPKLPTEFVLEDF